MTEHKGLTTYTTTQVESHIARLHEIHDASESSKVRAEAVKEIDKFERRLRVLKREVFIE